MCLSSTKVWSSPQPTSKLQWPLPGRCLFLIVDSVRWESPRNADCNAYITVHASMHGDIVNSGCLSTEKLPTYSAGLCVPWALASLPIFLTTSCMQCRSQPIIWTGAKGDLTPPDIVSHGREARGLFPMLILNGTRAVRGRSQGCLEDLE